MLKTYIYIIKNNMNGKAYIGRTIKPSDRFYRHKIRAFNSVNKEYGYALYNAIRKYGAENFTFTVLIVCSSDDAPYYESSLISKYQSSNKLFGYNILDGTEKSISHNKIVKDKISDSLKQYYQTNQHRNTGKHLSAETKDKISKAHLGKCSDLMRKHLAENNALYSKKVIISTINKEFIGEYESLNDAARKLNVDESCLSKVCRGKRLQHKGYIAQYAQGII